MLHYFMDLTPPVVQPLPLDLSGKGFFSRIWALLSFVRKWRVVEDYFLYIPWLGITIFIPAGFVLNFASVPRVLWPVMSPTGHLLLGSIPHDFGFCYGGLILWHDRKKAFVFREYPRGFLDALLIDITKCVTRSSVVGNLVHAFMYSASWGPWLKNRKKNASVFADFPSILKSSTDKKRKL